MLPEPLAALDCAAYLFSPDPDVQGHEWGSERFRKQMQRQSKATLGYQKINIQQWRHIAEAASYRYMREYAFAPGPEDDGGDHDEPSYAPDPF
ncbi:hypothetical protein N7520_011899 [Penicillium odoratum]|uniref:uncharacterized protein n=1 Tax=Penicillium odoratum TaxID=1167516 RepID=UPI002548BB60|nr:uncharacterized protein N7520_011899 [Penicillium odoratum]KAJ5746717.1 hypothetical protein N7520_011899 [Penicillium odoratum]